MIFRSRSSVAFSGGGVGTPVVDCPVAPGPDFTGAIDGLLASARIGDLRSSAEVPALEASTVADARIAVIILRMVCSHTGLILAPPIILLKPYSVTCELNHSQVSNHASARRSASCLLVPQVGAVCCADACAVLAAGVRRKGVGRIFGYGAGGPIEHIPLMPQQNISS